MKHKIYRDRTLWYLAITVILAVSLWFIDAPPASAQKAGEYFQFSYEPTTYSKNNIHGNEVFYATIRVRATCVKDLPVSVEEASITSRIMAQHALNGARVMLNSSYTVTLKPFPSKQGNTIEIEQVVPLQFPDEASSGNYNVIGELIEAKVKVAFVWGEVTEYLPRFQLMGSLGYTAPEATTTVTSAPTPGTRSSPELATPATAVPEPVVPWWVWLIVATAIVTTLLNLIWFLRHRGSTTDLK